MLQIRGRWIAVMALSLIVVSCKKKAIPATPPAPVVFPKSTKKEPPPNLPAPPVIDNPKKESETAPPVAVEVKPPPPPKPVNKKAGRAPKKAPDIKAEVRLPDGRLPDTPGAKPDANEPPKPAVIGFGEILTAEQIREYTRRLDAALDRSKSALVIIQSKTLNNSQRQQVGRISGFVSQAEQARVQDLATATSLAERADVLSKDLLSRLR
ncbi:MAG: hypothetical protein HY820_21150 [Acidobacteria bacterium]|nr:hypothetical protein [Acidobacteriota bacterium]